MNTARAMTAEPQKLQSSDSLLDMEEMRRRMTEAEETLAAIRSGTVDAVLVRAPDGQQRVYTLSGAERPYREMFDRLREGAVTLMADGTIMYCNSRFAVMIGEPLEKLIGKSVVPFVSPSAALSDFLATGGNGHVREEFELTRQDGEKIPALLSASPFEMEGHHCICMVVTDLTEQRTHERLRETENRLRRAVDAAGGLAYEVSITNGQICGLHGAQRMIGEDPPVNPPRSWWWERVHPEDRERCQESTRKAIEEGAPTMVMEYRVRHADGHYLFISDHGTFERKGPDDLRLFGVVLDISERKRNQERQRLLLGELNHRVKNTLATVQAIAAETRNHATSLDHFYRAYEGRLQALARAHSLLVQGGWNATSLQELVAEVTRLLMHDTARRKFIGQDASLSPAQALSLSMLLYELATNSVKYGAWSNDSGTISVQGDLFQDAAGVEQLRIEWVESGGPAVQAPARVGYGTRFMQGIAAYELGGDAQVTYDPRGLRCLIVFPMSQEGGQFTTYH